MANPTTDAQLNTVLGTLEKFGFKFFGYNESKEPLVIAPNGQIVSVDVAYKFVQSQMSGSAGGEAGIEVLPQMLQTPETPSTPEAFMEQGLESAREEQKNQEQETHDGLQPGDVKQQAPKIEIKKPNASPFGDGFPIKAFDPADVDQVIDFIRDNSKANDTTPKKWLAKQFEKFVAEMQNR